MSVQEMDPMQTPGGPGEEAAPETPQEGTPEAPQTEEGGETASE